VQDPAVRCASDVCCTPPDYGRAVRRIRTRRDTRHANDVLGRKLSCPPVHLELIPKGSRGGTEGRRAKAVFSSKVSVTNLEQYRSRHTVAIFVFIW
jgi:hypothetical protein